MTRATIGQGTITVAGVNTDPAGINRDLTRIDEITSDKITGALDATMSVDNRVFTGAGWASIASDVTNFWGNLAKAGEGAKNGMVNLGVAVGAVIGSLGGSGEGDEHVGPVDTAGKRIATMQTSNELMNTSKEFALLASGEPLTKDQRQQLAKDLQATVAKYGLTVDQFIFYLSEGRKEGGMYNPGDKAAGVPGSTVAVNLVGNDGEHTISGVEALERIFHEYGHSAYGPGKESAAHSLGNFASWYGRNILANLYGVDPTRQTQTVSNYIRDYADMSLAGNNELAENMDRSDKTERSPAFGYTIPPPGYEDVYINAARNDGMFHAGVAVQGVKDFGSGVWWLLTGEVTAEDIAKTAAGLEYVVTNPGKTADMVSDYYAARFEHFSAVQDEDPFAAYALGQDMSSTYLAAVSLPALLKSAAGGTVKFGGKIFGSTPAAAAELEAAAALRGVSSADAWESFGGFPAWSGADDLAGGYPGGFAVRINQPQHLAGLDVFTQRNGISGAHNADEFYKAASDYGAKIVSETPTDVPGITHITYQIPAKDKVGNTIPGVMKDKVLDKTVYDPKVFTDQKIVELGQEAAAKGYTNAIKNGWSQYSGEAGGVKFQIYVDKKTGTITNFHPDE